MTEEKSTSSDSTLPTTTEEWRDIPGYEGLYQVSDLGRLRRPHGVKRPGKRIQTGFIRPSVNRLGYLFLPLYQNGKRKQMLVHRLVMLAFVGQCPSNLVVNHKNGIRGDNRLNNLEYITQKENILHGIRRINANCCEGERWAVGENNNNARLTVGDVKEIRRLIRLGERLLDIAKLFGVTPTNIRLIKNKKTWSHVKD